MTILAVVLVAGITLAAGVMQGRMSGRWGPGNELKSLAEKISQIPEQIGVWRVTSSEALAEGPVKQLQAAGSFVRVYVNENTGQQVRVAMILGPAGPMSVHIPEICYSGRDYAAREKREHAQIPLGDDNPTAEMWSVLMQSNSLDGQILHVCYGWSDGIRWQAPESPRIQLAGSPYLYKLQLASEGQSVESLTENKACLEFLKDFLPALQPYLVAPTTTD